MLIELFVYKFPSRHHYRLLPNKHPAKSAASLGSASLVQQSLFKLFSDSECTDSDSEEAAAIEQKCELILGYLD